MSLQIRAWHVINEKPKAIAKEIAYYRSVIDLYEGQVTSLCDEWRSQGRPDDEVRELEKWYRSWHRGWTEA